MSGAIDCGVPGFNNIFEKLLMAGHLMACIETPDRGKFGLMHSLPPRMLIPTDPGRIYREQFDKTVKDSSDITDDSITSSKGVGLKDGLPIFNNFVKKLYANSKLDKDMRRKLNEVGSGFTSGSFDVYKGTNSFSGLDLPVSNQTFNKAGFDLLAKTAKIQVGGKMEDLKSIPAVTHIDMKEFTRIICSHKPQGYIGAKVKIGEQMYYCVDVSKIDEQIDYDEKMRYGCCFLVIQLDKAIGQDDKFIGRIMMKRSQFPDGYKVFSKDSENQDSAFDNKGSLYVNYEKTDMTPSELSTFIPTPAPGNFPQNLELTYLGQSYKFTFKNGNDFKKEPTLTAVAEVVAGAGSAAAAEGGSRTRKRRSKYLKRSV